MLEQTKIVLEIEKVINQLGMNKIKLADILEHNSVIVQTNPHDVTKDLQRSEAK